MPNYTFRDKRSGKVIEKNLPIEQRDDVPEHLERVIVPSRVAYVRGLDNPISPEVRVPIALKQLEAKKGYREICRGMGFPGKKGADRIKRTWAICAALTCLLALGTKAADIDKGYSFTPTDRVTSTKLNNLLDLATVDTTFITGKSAAQPVDADSLLFYSQSAGAFRKASFSVMLLSNTNLIAEQTEDTTPATNDFVLTYDASANSFKKVALDRVRALTYSSQLIVSNKPFGGTAYNFTHSLPARPQLIKVEIICTNAAGSSGYALNDIVPIEALTLASGNNAWWTAVATATAFKLNVSGAAMNILNPTGSTSSLTASDWNLRATLYYFPP